MYYSPITHMDHAHGAAQSRAAADVRRALHQRSSSSSRRVNSPIVLGTYKEEAPRIGAYFSEEIRQYIERSDKFGVENLYQRGLKVYSTLDLRMQQAAETALQRGLRRWDRRRGFRKPARNLVDRGDRSERVQRSELDRTIAYVPDKLYPAVVMAVDKNGVTARVGKDSMTLPAASFAWTQHKTMEGVAQDAATSSTSASMKMRRRTRSKWMLDQLPQVQGAVVILDVKTGEVRALVGGYDFQMSKFNRAIQSRRQTGSSFKPFVYGAAFEKGLTPADTVFDEPVAIPVGNQIYSPKNYYGKYAGIVTIQRALELSINVPAVKTWMMVGANHVVDFAKRCGITSDIPRYPSTALGAAGVSPIEMAGAYNVFANQGVYVKPRLDSQDRRSDRPRARGAVAGAVRGHAGAGGVRAGARDARDDRPRHRLRGAHAAAAAGRQNRDDELLHRRLVPRIFAGVHDRRSGSATTIRAAPSAAARPAPKWRCRSGSTS